MSMNYRCGKEYHFIFIFIMMMTVNDGKILNRFISFYIHTHFFLKTVYYVTYIVICLLKKKRIKSIKINVPISKICKIITCIMCDVAI